MSPAPRSGASPTPFPGPGFARFWWGETVSTFGSYISLLALQTLVVLTLDGGPQDVGWLNAARWLPYLLLGLVVGALVDRWPRRPVLVGTDLVNAVLLAMIPLAHLLDVLSLPLVLVVVLAIGAVSLVNDAASQSFVTRLVPGEHLQQAHARLDGAGAVAQTAGPALAGLLVKVVGAPLALLVDAATYVFSAGAMAGLRVEEPARSRAPEAPRSRLRREIAEGVRWVYGASGLARLAVATHVWFVAQAVVGVVVAPYALLVLGLTPLQLGLTAAAGGVGAVLGAAVTTRAGEVLGTGGVVIASHLLSAVGALVMVLAGLGGATGWGAVAVLAAGQLVSGAGLTMDNSHSLAYRQRLTPDHLQARTNITIRSFNRAVIVVGAPLAGLLAGTSGSRVALVVAAAVFTLAAAMLWLSPFRHVRMAGPGVSDR